MAMRGDEHGRHIDVTLPADLHAQVSHEVEKRGGTLAGFIRRCVLETMRGAVGVPATVAVNGSVVEEQLAGLRAAVEQLARDVRALVVVMAGVGAVVADAPPEDRELMTRSALELFDRRRTGGVRDDEG